MSCVRASEFAKKDKEEFDEIQKGLADQNLEMGKKIGLIRRSTKLKLQHEREKLASLQDGELKRQRKRESARDQVTSKEIKESKAQIKYLESRQASFEEAAKTHQENSKQADLKNRIAELQRQVDGIERERKEKAVKEKSEKVKELESQIADLKAQVKETDWMQERLREVAIKRKATAMDRRTAELQRRLAEGDYTKTPLTRERIMTPELEEKQRNIKKLERDIRREIAKIEYRDRSGPQKALDFLTSLKRWSILSSPKSALKLYAASGEVAFARLFTESSGYLLKKIPLIQSVAEKAAIEGGYKTKAEDSARAYWKGLVAGAKEMRDIIDGKSSYLDLKFGKDRDIPDNWTGFFGRLHEAIKNPTRLANYEMAYQRYLDWAVATKPEVSRNDPSIINQAEVAAFRFANESIFKEDNYVVRQYNKIIAQSKKSGPVGQAVGFALEQTLPIVKIPTNIIKQTFEYAFGTAPGTYRLIRAVSKGIENLSYEEADIIMRQFKRGSAGLVMMALGAFLEPYLGGIYIKGEEKGDEDQEYGSFGPIPRTLLENPLFACLQIGATMKRFWTRHVEESDTPVEFAGQLANGFLHTSLGLVEEAPFVKSMVNFEKILHGGERTPITLTEMYARPYIPAWMQYWADLQDLQTPLSEGTLGEGFHNIIAPEATKRAPENILQALYLSIPSNPVIPSRKDVPER